MTESHGHGKRDLSPLEQTAALQTNVLPQPELSLSPPCTPPAVPRPCHGPQPAEELPVAAAAERTLRVPDGAHGPVIGSSGGNVLPVYEVCREVGVCGLKMFKSAGAFQASRRQFVFYLSRNDAFLSNV